MKNRIINVQDVPISISEQKMDDYICITDIAKAKTGESRSADVVKKLAAKYKYIRIFRNVGNDL